MKPTIPTILAGAAIVILSAAHTGPAFATLGEGADSVAKDRKALSATKRATTTRAANYSVQEVVSDTVTVREFISPDGVVFAVAWNGLTTPDLTTLFGSYFPEYQDAKQQAPRRHGHKQSRVKSGNIVVETWGHMRNLQGRAYVPALVPGGVNLEEIH
ncbi:DUF2844 domain-containing protein [Geomonas sp.]|uniref:DUF2844 domain-containing protein n=1 Tax=Geomonas sp. TaxID=2651584 RepID=UPI002B49FCAD|nr:DUF2844 domain-containing protein [Geomonas sp.]HJV36678.1 DUF2844 domain-containing protein [Geomonas sp.]